MRVGTSIGIRSLALLAAGLSTAAYAEDTGWYLGFNVGQSREHLDTRRISDGLLRPGLGTASIAEDSRDMGYKLFAGHDLNRFLSLEGGYYSLGEFGFTTTTVPAGTASGRYKFNGLNLDGILRLPLSDRMSLFGRIGANYGYTRDYFSGTGAVVVPITAARKHDLNYKFGAGMQYDFTPSVGLRVEAERYRVDNAVGQRGDIDLLSAGFVYRFDRRTPIAQPVVYTTAPRAPVVLPAPAPEPVAAAPAPAPAPMPPPPIRRKVSFSADALFDFGSESLREAGRQELERFAQELRGSQYDDIAVTGYTDRIGSAAYNEKLSLRRAEAVKDYLVVSAGLPGNKITTRGAAGSDPVTKADECQGQQRTPKLIACLQPDRRVEVEVNASQLQAAPRN